MNTTLKMRLGLAIAAVIVVLLILGFTGVITDTQHASAQGTEATPTPWIITATPEAGQPTTGPQVMPYGWMPSSIVTATPVAPNNAPTNNGDVRGCFADKIATVNEFAGNGPQRMEISTGDLIHLDYYQTSGLPTVSVLVRTGEVAVLRGYGSEWQFPLRDCATYDFVKDATDYAHARQIWDHSGLVFNSLTDWLNGNAPIVNLYNVDYRLPKYRPVLWENKTGTTFVNPTTYAPAPNMTPAANSFAPQTQNASQCADGLREDRDPVVDVPWTPKGDVRVVNLWTNQPGFDQHKNYKLLLRGNENPKLLMGGASWSWSTSCTAKAEADFAKNPNTPVTVAELDTMGLVLH